MPSRPELARTLLAADQYGTLATIDTDGRPILSRLAFVDDGDGSPVFVINNLSAHVIRARQDQRASFSLDSGLLLQGNLALVPGLEQLALEPELIEAHPDLQTAAESIDYSWFRLIPERVRLMTPGDETSLATSDLAGAEPDALTLAGHELVESVREAIGDDALLLIKALGGRWIASEAELTGIDRYGLRFEVIEPAGRSHGRVAFPERLQSAADVHVAVAGLVTAARLSPSASSALNGVEGDGSGGADIDGIDGSGHRNLGSNSRPVERALSEAWSFGSEQESDGLVWIEPQGSNIDGIDVWSEGEDSEALVDDSVEAVGERAESGIRESESLTH